MAAGRVETKSGTVSGIEKSGVLQFRGIPFAAPPVGHRRFRAPQPPEPWTGVYEAESFRPSAPQARGAASLLPGPEKIEWSEDCLYLNVFTPLGERAMCPVMVWIHGGGFTGGSGRDAWYNGTSFARNGIVVVTINYRLGALGFLHLEGLLGGEFASSGNCGILDQIAALEWVRDNIEVFGGDPSNVTIFGESAGGMSVGTLLGTPAAAGLFHRAIPQSGAAQNVSTVERASEIAERIVAALGTSAPALADLPAERILEGQVKVVEGVGRDIGVLPFQPVVDGKVIPEQPLAAVRKGSSADLSLMTGTTRDEMTLFALQDPRFRQLDEEAVLRRLERVRPGTARTLYDAYAAGRPGAEPRDVWVAIETDRVFRIPAIRLADAHMARRIPAIRPADAHVGRGGDAYVYLFTWESPAIDGALKSCHALEVPFMWNSLGVRGTDMFAGGGPEADALADAMHRSWISFARTGGPNHNGIPAWPGYHPSRRATMVFGRERAVEDDPMGAERAVWDELG